VTEIQKQLAYLAWRRSQVEGSIRAIMETEKAVAERDTLLSLSHNETRAKQIWTQEIVADELCKSLELSKNFVTGFEDDVERERRREERSNERHLKNLDALKEKIMMTPQNPVSDKLLGQITSIETRIGVPY